MAALNTDKLKKLSRKWVAQIGSGGVSDDTSTTIPLSTTTNLPTDTAVVATIDRVDANGTKTSSLEETVIGVVSGSNLINCVRGAEGTAQAHSAGAVVEILVTAKGWNDLIDHLLVQHTQLGVHTDALVTSLKCTGSEITASATGDLKIVTPKAIADSDLAFLSDITVTASSTTTFTNKDLTSTTNTFPIYCQNKVVSIQVYPGGDSVATGDGQTYITIPLECNGMNLVGVHARVVTAGTTNTTDIQIRNVTDSVDILSTKLTIDSGETGSDTAATPAVIDTTKDDVATNDLIAIDIDQVSTTAPKGLIVVLRFARP